MLLTPGSDLSCLPSGECRATLPSPQCHDFRHHPSLAVTVWNPPKTMSPSKFSLPSVVCRPYRKSCYLAVAVSTTSDCSWCCGPVWRERGNAVGRRGDRSVAGLLALCSQDTQRGERRCSVDFVLFSSLRCQPAGGACPHSG